MVGPAHHLGNFRVVGPVDSHGVQRVAGTLRGALGFIPKDTGQEITQSIAAGPYTIKSTSWKQVLKDNCVVPDGPLYKQFADFAVYHALDVDSTELYPRFDFPALVGLSYNPDPPSPAWKLAGVAFELQQFKPEWAFPHREQQMEQLEHVVLVAWRKRVVPLVDLLEQIYKLKFKYPV